MAVARLKVDGAALDPCDELGVCAEEVVGDDINVGKLVVVSVHAGCTSG